MFQSNHNQKKTVLVVDDSSTALMMTQMILSEHTQYQVETAQDGEQAVAVAQSAKPDLILMDVVMPRMNGFEACRELRRLDATKAIPVILLTTRGEEDCVTEGFSSGCNDYLTKPVDPDELIALLYNYIGE